MPTKVLPPCSRSQTADYLTIVAQQKQFKLQVCQECNTVQYPPRDVCGHCLGETLNWQSVSNLGTVIAKSVLHHSILEYFKDKTPYHIALVKLDCGPSIIVSTPSFIQVSDKVVLSITLDQSQKAILVANLDCSKE